MTIVSVTGPSNPQEIRKYLMRRTKDEIVSEYLRQWRYCGELEAERDQLREQNAKMQSRLFELNAEKHSYGEEGAALSKVLAAVTAERDALAAHVERMTRLWLDMDDCETGSNEQMVLIHGMHDAIRDHYNDNTVSLTQRDARMKAEALETFREEFELHSEVPDFILGSLEEYAEEYRQQAEGGA